MAAAERRRVGTRWIARVALLAVIVLPLMGQSRQFRFRGDDADFSAMNVGYRGGFTFLRMRFTPTPWGGRGGGGFFGSQYWWDHDYPDAEANLAIILNELTTVDASAGGNIHGVEEADFFKYPIAYVSEPGHWTITDAEAANLRAYLHKGGFIIFDDFAGSDWFTFESTLRIVLPEARLVRLDVSHPVFHSFFDIRSLDQRHPNRGMAAEFYGVFENNDPTKRLVAIANYNNDIGDAWEWSSTGYIPIDLTNEAFKLGVNYIVYAMTH